MRENAIQSFSEGDRVYVHRENIVGKVIEKVCFQGSIFPTYSQIRTLSNETI